MRETLLSFFLIYAVSVSSQITNIGFPASWSLIQKSDVNAISLPNIEIKKIKAEDDLNSKSVTKQPYRVGIPTDVNYGIENNGFWTNLPNGDRIWRILFKSDNAIHLSVVFDKFYLPKGGNIFMYNDDRTDLLGAYTDIENNEKEVLASWFVKGDKIWIEYYEPKEVKGQGKLHISKVIHGYRFGHHYQKGYYEDFQKDLNDSEDCHYDVNCFIGSDFESHKDLLKKSVAFLNMGDGFICSGALVNNTAQDRTPYFLSANHCYVRNTGLADPSLFSMRFNWISSNPVCAEAINSTNGPQNMVMTGSTFRARHVLSDFVLVEIDGVIPTEWDVTYAGWDKSETDPTFQVGIHHPKGDIMKISRDNNGATKIVYPIESEDLYAWLIEGTKDSSNTPAEILAAGWEMGSTEGGSSGSPLFNQNGKIIGQLWGGWGGCNGLNDNSGAALYGRFAISWVNGLKQWLDPLNTDQDILESLQGVLAVNDEFLENNITIFPNPTEGVLQIKASGLIGNLKYHIYNVLGQNIKYDQLQNNTIVNLKNLPSDIYFIKITEIDTNRSFVKKIVLTAR